MSYTTLTTTRDSRYIIIQIITKFGQTIDSFNIYDINWKSIIDDTQFNTNGKWFIKVSTK